MQILLRCRRFLVSSTGSVRRYQGSGVLTEAEIDARSEPFMSSANRMKDPAAVRAFLEERLATLVPDERGFPAIRDDPDTQVLKIRECPTAAFCEKSDGYANRRRGDNEYTFHVFKNSGSYNCFRCNASGNIMNFKAKISGVSFNDSKPLSQENPTFSSRKNDDEVPASEKNYKCPKAAEVQAYPLRLLENAWGVCEWLEQKRGLTLNTLLSFGCGATSRKFFDMDTQSLREEGCVTFPWMQDDMMVRLKTRSIMVKGNQRAEPKGGGWAFFGGSVFSEDERTNTCVITEGEFDAMSVYQATQYETFSLPNGAQSLPPQMLPRLERYTRIYLWLDDDEAGQAGAERFMKKLGVGRCRNVKPLPSWPRGIKDANDALRAKLDLKAALLAATAPTHKELKTSADYRSDIMQELTNPNAYSGVPITSIKSLQDKLKGIRRGEMTLLTGGTGTGKTTFCSQLSLDLVNQQAPTLWGSFEVKNHKLIIKMLRQKYQRRATSKPTNFLSTNVSLEKTSKDLLGTLMDNFESLPLHFMSFHGATDIDRVIDAMEFARYIHDVDHIFLDNLQFMTGVSTGTFSNAFMAMDRVVAKCRAFASQHDVHVFLVVHPRKEPHGEKLTLQSVWGTGKATQEADNVLILNSLARPTEDGNGDGAAGHYSQRKKPDTGGHAQDADHLFKSIDVVKCREKGDLGSVHLRFDTESQRYIEIGQGIR